MNSWLSIRWDEIFVLQQSPLETAIRASLVYLSLFLLLRFGLRREWGLVAMSDLLLVVLLAEAATEAIAMNVRSAPDCIVAAAAIIFWAYALDWLAYRSKIIGRLLNPAPLPLIRDGQMLRRNMRRELITEEELMGQLRQHGVNELSEVREALIESNGHISVVTRNGQSSQDADPPTVV